MTADFRHPPGPPEPSFAVRALREIWRLATDSPYRRMRWLRWRPPPGLFQPFNDTHPNRYPRIFRFVQAELGAESDVNILSYGCSTGEEVFSLRKYFPRAAIKGLDINPANIAACRRRMSSAPDDALAFEVASSTMAEPAAWYDAIFCMAVFRHGSLDSPSVTRCDHLIRFEDFARSMEDFSRCLKPGGLLIVRHSNFRVCDTPAAAHFETMLRFVPHAKSPVFDANNQLMKGVDNPDTVFRKLD